MFSSCKFPEIFKAGPLIPPSAIALSCCLGLMIFGRQQDTWEGVGLRHHHIASMGLPLARSPNLWPQIPPLENGATSIYQGELLWGLGITMNCPKAAPDTSFFLVRGVVGLGDAPGPPLPSLLCLWGPLAHQYLCQRMAGEGWPPHETPFLCIRKRCKSTQRIRYRNKCSEISTFWVNKLPDAEAVDNITKIPSAGCALRTGLAEILSRITPVMA